MSMKVSHAQSTAADALLICKNSLWPHTAGEKFAYHLSHLWTVQRLQATGKKSDLCKTILQSTLHVTNTKLHEYCIRRVAHGAAQAFIAHSRASADLQSAMTSACNAVLCAMFATGGQGVTSTLAWCQVCTCAAMRLLQKQGYKWQILRPWDVQPSLSKHTLTECICEHALKQPRFRKSIRAVIQSQAKRDVGTLHDETEAIFMQLLREVPCRGVEDMQQASVKRLCQRCNRHLSKHKLDYAEADNQLQLVFAYLLLMEVRRQL